MSLTPAQQAAITARGNVLMVAGAGTGKTTTLVERCLHCLLEAKPPVGLDEILMVTFTEASRHRHAEKNPRSVGEKTKPADSAAPSKKENDLWLAEQLALFETAHIGTLHSFCLQLVRQHFYELELDPQLSVLPEEEAKLLADETLEDIFQAHYAGKTEAAERSAATHSGTGSRLGLADPHARIEAASLHANLARPGGWFDAQLAMFQVRRTGAMANLAPRWRGRVAQSLAARVASRNAGKQKGAGVRGHLEKLARLSFTRTMRRHLATSPRRGCRRGRAEKSPRGANRSQDFFDGGGLPAFASPAATARKIR